MNNYFCSICTELANKIDYSSNPLLSVDYHINDKSEKFNVMPVNAQDIRTHSLKQKRQRALGMTTYPISISDGKRSFIMNFRIIVMTSHIVDKLEKEPFCVDLSFHFIDTSKTNQFNIKT